jgi:hypothetical protein
MIKRYMHGLIVVGVVVSGCLSAENFVLKPARPVSVGALKEECAQLYAHILKELFQITGMISSIEAQILEHSLQLIEGDPHSSLVKAKRTELQQYVKKLSTFKEKLATFHEELAQQLASLPVIGIQA